MICTVFFSSFLASNVHRVLTLLPEALSFLILVVVLVRLAAHKSLSLGPKYLILGILVLLHVLTGLIVNSVAPGILLTGLRPYVKWLPVFLLPMVYPFSEKEIGGQLRLVLGLSIIQCPIALYQRFVQYRGVATGDVVTGTLGSSASGALSVFMLSVIAVLLAYFIRGRVRTGTFIIVLCILFLPTMINETKATLVLLPIVLMIPYIYASRKRLSVPQLAGMFAISFSLLIGFVYVYDQIGSQLGRGDSILEFVTSDRSTSYLYSKKEFYKEKDLLDRVKIGGLELPRDVIDSKEGGGRVDKILLPINTLSGQPLKLWLGLGVGNVSKSIIDIFSGEYAVRLGAVSGEMLLTLLLWETGVGGVIIFIMFLSFLIIDAHKLSKSGNTGAIFASGWLAVLVVVLIAIAYTNMFYFNALIFTFAYFSGYVVSRSASLKYDSIRENR
jgi:hypothetical protein